jgi:hypothetical protein
MSDKPKLYPHGKPIFPKDIPPSPTPLEKDVKAVGMLRIGPLWHIVEYIIKDNIVQKVTLGEANTKQIIVEELKMALVRSYMSQNE